MKKVVGILMLTVMSSQVYSQAITPVEVQEIAPVVVQEEVTESEEQLTTEEYQMAEEYAAAHPVVTEEAEASVATDANLEVVAAPVNAADLTPEETQVIEQYIAANPALQEAVGGSSSDVSSALNIARRARSVYESIRSYTTMPEANRVGGGVGYADGIAGNLYGETSIGSRVRVEGNSIFGSNGFLVRGRFAGDYSSYIRELDFSERTSARIRLTPAIARILLGTTGFYLAAEPTADATLNANFRLRRTEFTTRFLVELGAALGLDVRNGDVSAVFGFLSGVRAGADIHIPRGLLQRFKIYVDLMYRAVRGFGSDDLSTTRVIEAGLRRLDRDGNERFNFGVRGANEGGVNYWGANFSMRFGRAPVRAANVDDTNRTEENENDPVVAGAGAEENQAQAE